MLAEGLADEALGALLRQEGLHAAQLAEWRAAAEAAVQLVPYKCPSDLGARGRYHGPEECPMIPGLIEEASSRLRVSWSSGAH